MKMTDGLMRQEMKFELKKETEMAKTRLRTEFETDESIKGDAGKFQNQQTREEPETSHWEQGYEEWMQGTTRDPS